MPRLLWKRMSQIRFLDYSSHLEVETLRIFFSFNVIMSWMSLCKKTLFRIFYVKITCCCCTLSGTKKMEIYSVAFSGHLFLHLLPREEHGPLCFPRILLCQFDPEKAPGCTTKWMKSFLMKRLWRSTKFLFVQKTADNSSTETKSS